MRILACALVLAACGPAATPTPVLENTPPPQATEQPAVAVVVIVDRSGSMQGGKLDAARDGAQAVADALPDGAMFAMIAFDSAATTLVPMQTARHRAEIAAGIATLEAGGGTDYRPALASAAQLLDDVSAARKVIVFLSDGEAPYDGVVEILADAATRGVTTSTIGLAGADLVLLGQMADAGGGIVVMVDALDDLAAVMRQTIE